MPKAAQAMERPDATTSGTPLFTYRRHADNEWSVFDPARVELFRTTTRPGAINAVDRFNWIAFRVAPPAPTTKRAANGVH